MKFLLMIHGSEEAAARRTEAAVKQIVGQT